MPVSYTHLVVVLCIHGHQDIGVAAAIVVIHAGHLNLSLIHISETKEEKRIEDFVIAVDTSMSTSGELVRQFLACTYAILRSTETFTWKVNIRILQCDDQVRSDTPIHDLEELKTYMENFQLVGGSATDFRPAVSYTHLTLI